MQVPKLIRVTMSRYDKVNGPLLAKGLSFNFLMGILPLIFLSFLTAALLVDLFPGMQDLLEREFLDFLPRNMQQIVNNQLAFLGRSTGTLGVLTVAAFIVTVFFLFESLERIIRTMLGSEPRTWLKARGISLLMVVSSLLFVYAAAILSFGVRVVNDMGLFGGRFLPVGAFLLTLVLTGGFLAACMLIYSRRRLKPLPLILICLLASLIWHLFGSAGGLLVRTAGRRFIVYGAMAGAVTYTLFLRVLAEIVIFSTLLVRYFALGEKGEPEEE